MALNANIAHNQAGQLNNNISQLQNAKRQLFLYKSSISNNWQGQEVGYILKSIDQVIAQINTAINELESLGRDIKKAANQIRQEELAAEAAARARAKKQAEIRAAQKAYNEAQEDLEKLQKKQEKLMKKLKNASIRDMFDISKELDQLKEKIEKAERKCEEKNRLLRAVKR